VDIDYKISRHARTRYFWRSHFFVRSRGSRFAMLPFLFLRAISSIGFIPRLLSGYSKMRPPPRDNLRPLRHPRRSISERYYRAFYLQRFFRVSGNPVSRKRKRSKRSFTLSEHTAIRGTIRPPFPETGLESTRFSDTAANLRGMLQRHSKFREK